MTNTYSRSDNIVSIVSLDRFESIATYGSKISFRSGSFLLLNLSLGEKKQNDQSNSYSYEHCEDHPLDRKRVSNGRRKLRELFT